MGVCEGSIASSYVSGSFGLAGAEEFGHLLSCWAFGWSGSVIMLSVVDVEGSAIDVSFVCNVLWASTAMFSY